MRYTEPKDKSAELLRLTLSHMGRHAAAFNPLTFTLWYEYAAGIKPKLNAAVDELVAKATIIDDAMVAQLCDRHVFPADAQAIDNIRARMQMLMTGMAQTASQTSNRAGLFGEQLTGLTAALATHDVGQLQPQISELLAGTTEMKRSVDALQTKVQTSQQEIDRLRGDLERARGEALLDPLTGILNRKGFDQMLHAMVAQPPADGATHCLVMIDIDHFKKVNDTHGHLMGDRVIQAVGEILRTTVQMPSAKVARYGGEEFAILLPATTVEHSKQLTEAVRARAKAMKIKHRNTQEVLTTVTVSGGIAGLRRGEDALSLLARADAALYASKNGGRDRVTVV
jgi:diguanylate cyclase